MSPLFKYLKYGLLPLLLLVGPGVVLAAEPDRVLMLGNSFSRGLKRPLAKLFEARGIDLTVKAQTPSREGLGYHLRNRQSLRRLDRGPWDVVVLQEHHDGIDSTTYGDVRTLDAMIRARGATPLLFMTWRNDGSPLSDYDSLRGEAGGTVGYMPIAFELGVGVAPVGWTFRALIEDLGFNAASMLWRSWRHTSTEGKYLTACVFYAAMLGESPAAIGWHPKRIEPSMALYLRSLAAQVVLTDPAEWNLQFDN